MKITLKLFATLADYLPAGAKSNEVSLEYAAEAPTVAAVIAAHRLPDRLVHLVLVNGHFVAPDARAELALTEGDVLAIWPPIAGG